MERSRETYMNFPIEETREHDQSQLPSSKRRHVEESPSVFHEPPLVSEEEGGHVPLGNVSGYNRDLLDQESKPPSYGVLDLERREPILNQPPHQDVTTWFNFVVLGRQEIPPSEEDMPEKASFQPENDDKEQSVVVPCSPADSLASGSRRLGQLQISENPHGPFTPRTPSTPIVLKAQEETCRKPQRAQVVGNSELCAVCPIVDIKELPSHSRSLEEMCNRRELIPDGGLAVYVALLQVVRKEYDVHQKMLSLFGLVGLQNVYLIMPSSLKERFQVFMTPDVERLSANFKTMDLESNVAKHRKGRLADVKALEPFVKLVTRLMEQAKIHVSQTIRDNLKDALRICGKADNGSYLANVYQALKGNKDICLVEVHTGITGHREKFPIVCLEGEKILLVVEEWLMKNHKGRRLSDENIHLVTCDQHSYPVDDSREVSDTLHRVRLVRSPPSVALVPPNHPHGGGSGVISHQQPATFSGDCPRNQPWSSQPFSTQDHGDHYQNPNRYTYPQVTHPSGSFERNEVPLPPPGHLNGVPPPPPPPGHLRGVPPPPPPPRHLHGVPPPPPPPRHLHGVPLHLPPPNHHRGNSTRYRPPYPPSPSIAGCSQQPTAPIGLRTPYRPSHVSSQGMDPSASGSYQVLN